MRTYTHNGITYREFSWIGEEYVEHSVVACKLAGYTPIFLNIDERILLCIPLDEKGKDPAAYDIFMGIWNELTRAYSKRLETLGFPVKEHFRKTGKAPFLGCEQYFWPEYCDAYKKNGHV